MTENKNKNAHYHLAKAKKAATEASKVLRNYFQDDTGIISALNKDIKTKADLTAEKIIIDILKETGLLILSEEKGIIQGTEKSVTPKDILLFEDPIWIVDPLDGTYNFVRQIPVYSVSICLWIKGQPLVGVIADIPNDKTYCGIVGEGATCNEKVIKVSEQSEITQSCLATGFPTERNYDENSLMKSVRHFKSFKKIRMIGSASLSLANVACGNFDSYFEEGIKIWDVSAGLALVLAAGGKVHFTEINNNWQSNVCATNNLLPLYL